MFSSVKRKLLQNTQDMHFCTWERTPSSILNFKRPIIRLMGDSHRSLRYLAQNLPNRKTRSRIATGQKSCNRKKSITTKIADLSSKKVKLADRAELSNGYCSHFQLASKKHSIFTSPRVAKPVSTSQIFSMNFLACN